LRNQKEINVIQDRERMVEANGRKRFEGKDKTKQTGEMQEVVNFLQA
jgi:hypothetical protein